MKRIKEFLVITLVISAALLLMLHQLNKVGYQHGELPHTVSPIETTIRNGAQIIAPQTSGQNTTTPTLDGALLGVNLEELRPLLGKPCAQWYYPFLLAGWEKHEWSIAKWIIYRESRCLQYAFNGVDAGLMQINEFHIPLVESLGLRFPDDLFDGETNLWVANVLWWDYGWEPWKYKGVTPGEKKWMH